MAEVAAEGSYSCRFDNRSFECRAVCVTGSDEKGFTHSVELCVNTDGKPVFQKSWEEKVPREFC